MAESIERITPEDARDRMTRSPGTPLVCAYDDAQKFQRNHLQGAMSLNEFRNRLASFPANQEIIFYCA